MRFPYASSLAVLVACGPAIGDVDGSGGSGDSSAAADGGVETTSGTADDGIVTVTSATNSETSSSDPDDGPDDTGPICILHHHEVGIPGECDHDSDCCRGEKCVPMDDGTCVPLADDPADIGEPCTARGIVDDCVANAVCRGVDVETGEGICVQTCDAGHACIDRATICVEHPSYLCLPPCDPLAAACPGTDACVPFDGPGLFACWPDAGASIPGAFGDPCWDTQAQTGCDAGAICLHEQFVQSTSCANDLDEGCCTWFCDTDDPIACADTETGICEPLATALETDWPAEIDPTLGYCR
jgi:hypothetical protein